MLGPRSEASWRSGDAADCKSVHPGSIPGEASNSLHPACAAPAIRLASARRLSFCLYEGLARPPAVAKRRCAFDARWLFRGSSVVEQPAVNRLVVGSNPTRGANISWVFLIASPEIGTPLVRALGVLGLARHQVCRGIGANTV